MAHDVFVSYSSKDKAVADAIVATLEKVNIRCWYAPRDIKPGEDWGKSITEAIKTSKVFLLIFSGNANKSQRVLDEVNFAISRELVLLPFRIENLEPSDAMMLHLASRHWLDAFDPSWERNLSKLAQIVATNLDSSISEVDLGIQQRVIEGKKGSQKARKIIQYALIGSAIIAIASFGIFKIFSNGQPESMPTATIPISTVNVQSTPASSETTPISLPIDGVINIAFVSEMVELDPRIASNIESTTLGDNLFLSLTKLDYEIGEVVPEAAKSWSISMDGRLYTFKIRTDIPWVVHELGGETEIVKDENGHPRYLTAQDFVNSIRQICTPQLADDTVGSLFYSLIKGCKAVAEYPDPSNIPTDLMDAIGVKVISDDELLIELENPSAYFLSMTSINILAAIPEWSQEKYGSAWKNPGVIITNGYFVVNEFQLGENLQLVRNMYLPDDLSGNGNIREINIQIGVDNQSAYNLWLNSEIDFSTIPSDKIEDHLTGYPDETLEAFGVSQTFIEFNTVKAPFDNVHARRAFGAALDKAAYISLYLKELATPTKHIGIPGLVGAPLLNEIGIDFDQEYARSELLKAGYPNCEGFPPVVMKGPEKRYMPDEFLRSWEQVLGCPEFTITADFKSENPRDNTHMFFGGWSIDYPDENNLIGDVLSCTSKLSDYWLFKRDCNEIDELISQAQKEINPARRSALYYQIEEAFFERDGEYPIAPFYLTNEKYAVRSWLDARISQLGLMNFYDWVSNQPD